MSTSARSGGGLFAPVDPASLAALRIAFGLLMAVEAVRFFAEVGFGGDTRELAKRAHVTHALLFRYFPSKQALIERVYQEVYLGRWNPQWEQLIQDRRLPLRWRDLAAARRRTAYRAAGGGSRSAAVRRHHAGW